jgi:hypothetical protein
MTIFNSISDELHATQQAAEELLFDIASSELPPSDHDLLRLEKLASSCARLAFPNGLTSSLSPSAYNLITWCDHLNDPVWKADFLKALQNSPLQSPWPAA